MAPHPTERHPIIIGITGKDLLLGQQPELNMISR